MRGSGSRRAGLGCSGWLLVVSKVAVVDSDTSWCVTGREVRMLGG